MKGQYDAQLKTTESMHRREKECLTCHILDLKDVEWALKVSAAYLLLTVLYYCVLLFLVYHSTI